MSHRPLTYEKETLLADLKRTAEKLGCARLTKSLYDTYGTIATSTVQRHFGGWLKALQAAGMAYAANDRRDTSHCPRIETPTIKPERGYGRPIACASMPYAPTSELGVAMLFAIMAKDLGFSIEHVSEAFPDCLAKRLTEGKYENGWKDLAIEFEYRSSKFKAHGHDPAKCSLLVCWLHDWADCPLEVIELSKMF